MHRWFLLIPLVLAACSSGGDSGRGGNTDFPDDGMTLTGTVDGHTDVEPNDDIAMAQPLTVPTPGPDDDFVGFQVNGQISPIADPADTFAFTASRADTYSMELCQADCFVPLTGVSLDPSVAYFEVLDQSGSLLYSSQGGTPNGNYMDVEIAAGALYYVRIRAETTMAGAQSYFLIAIESIY